MITTRLSAHSPVVQMVVISLGAVRRISWVRRIVVLPVHIHEAWEVIVSVLPRKNRRWAYFAVNIVRDDLLKVDSSRASCKLYWVPICARIGTAAASADCTSGEKIDDEHAALNDAVKLFEYVDRSSDGHDGTWIPSINSTARIVDTKFFWTTRGTIRSRMKETISNTYKCQGRVSGSHSWLVRSSPRSRIHFRNSGQGEIVWSWLLSTPMHDGSYIQSVCEW